MHCRAAWSLRVRAARRALPAAAHGDSPAPPNCPHSILRCWRRAASWTAWTRWRPALCCSCTPPPSSPSSRCLGGAGQRLGWARLGLLSGSAGVSEGRPRVAAAKPRSSGQNRVPCRPCPLVACRTRPSCCRRPPAWQRCTPASHSCCSRGSRSCSAGRSVRGRCLHRARGRSTSFPPCPPSAPTRRQCCVGNIANTIH